jgi:hypothetical protein
MNQKPFHCRSNARAARRERRKNLRMEIRRPSGLGQDGVGMREGAGRALAVLSFRRFMAVRRDRLQTRRQQHASKEGAQADADPGADGGPLPRLPCLRAHAGAFEPESVWQGKRRHNFSGDTSSAQSVF